MRVDEERRLLELTLPLRGRRPRTVQISQGPRDAATVDVLGRAPGPATASVLLEAIRHVLRLDETAVQTLQPPQRLPLLAAALGRFFAAVNIAIVVLWASGLAMLLAGGGWARAHWGVQAMLAVGLLMTVVYLHLRLALYPRLRRAVAEATWPQAAAQLDAIRVRVVFNLSLGALVFVLATAARGG